MTTVIEAVFESVELKRGVFQRLDAITAPTAGLASNTSSISISSLGGALREGRGSRFLGTHFFSPVSRMRLVEVVPAMDTDPAFVEQISETLTAVSKTPVRVKDVVDFAVNRPARSCHRVYPSYRGGSARAG
jgi:3-hydroxybutyryl-CoA dehydrogenase